MAVFTCAFTSLCTSSCPNIFYGVSESSLLMPVRLSIHVTQSAGSLGRCIMLGLFGEDYMGLGHSYTPKAVQAAY